MPSLARDQASTSIGSHVSPSVLKYSKQRRAHFNAVPSLQSLRNSTPAEAVSLLTHVWAHYQSTGQWPLCRLIHSKLGKPKVQELCARLNGGIIFETEQSGLRHYQLSAVGVLLTSDGVSYQHLLVAYLDYLRTLFQTAPEKEFVTKDELAITLKLDDSQGLLLSQLISTMNLYSRSASFGKDTWQFGVLHEAEDFPPIGDLTTCLESLIFRTYNPALAISYEEQVKAWSVPNLAATAGHDGVTALPRLSESNPLKRRYQVFVSSTFDDLREERQHAIQALLESKCIPSGMELFPAASTSQWELIRRVIDDCDYYIVIIAGRYGSLTPDGSISYTEREFDYAFSIGKPIIAFCHEDIDQLQGAKLEKSDAGRERLEAFRSKAEERMCRFWRTPEALASAIKSAIFNAIEHQPQPGWVRATTILAEQDTIAKLQQRVSELERALDKKRDSTPARTDPPNASLSISVRGHYYTTKDTNDRPGYWSQHKPLSQTIEKPWADIFKILAPRLETSASFASLKKTLEAKLAVELTEDIQKTSSETVYGMTCTVQTQFFDTLLRTLHSRDLIKPRPHPKDAHVKKPYWSLTPAGAKYFAELHAIT